MSTARTATQVGVITLAAAAAALASYAVYFDYMRRHDAGFRKSIRKQHRKVQLQHEERAREQKEKDRKALRAVLAEIQGEPSPVSPEQQELYFQEQVAEGEKLAAMGPENAVKAASHFYRALRVYPQPVELLMIYQKVVPAPVFALLVELTTLTGAGAGMGGAPGSGVPQRAQASLSDIDDASPFGGMEALGVEGSPNGSGSGNGSGASGVEGWDRLSQEEGA